VQYRSLPSLRNGYYLGPRLYVFALGFLLMSLYFGIGNDLSGPNLTNIAAVLFMSILEPSFSASTYIPVRRIGSSRPV
jgi:hypothetical protein